MIIPLLTIYPLRTSKYLDFKDWAEAIQIVNNSSPSNRKGNRILSPESFASILELKNRMNYKRLSVNPLTIPVYPMSPNWLIAFIEGEGSFFISGAWFSPVFSISQNNQSKNLIEQIGQFILSLPFKIPAKVELSIQKVDLANSKLIEVKELNKTFIYSLDKNNATSFSLQNKDLLFVMFLPFLESKPFYTRKFKHFQFWSFVLKLKMAGYNLIPEGLEIIKRIAKGMNDGSYSTCKIQHSLPDVDSINNFILNKESYASVQKTKKQA